MEIANPKVTLALDNSQFKSGLRNTLNGLKQIHAHSVQLNQSFELLKNSIAAVSQAIQSAWNMAKSGAMLADVRKTFATMAKSMGKMPDELLQAMKRATKGSITELQAMQTAGQAALAGMGVKDFLLTLRYASEYSKAMGKEFNQTLQTMMTGLTRGSTQILDDVGILISQTELIKRKEAELGRSFTDQEKRAAILAEAYRQMAHNLKGLGDDAKSTYDHMRSLEAQWQDFKNSMGVYALRAFGFAKAVGKAWQGIYVQVKIWVNQLNLYIEESFGASIRAVREVLMRFMLTLRDYAQSAATALSKLNSPLARAAQAAADLFNVGAIKLFDANMNSLVGTTKANLKAVLSELKGKKKEIDAEIRDLQRLMSGQSDGAGKAGTFTPAVKVGQSSVVSGLTDTELNKRKGYLDQIKRLSLTEIEYAKWKHKQELAELKKAVKQKILTQAEYNEFRKASLAEISKMEMQASGTASQGWAEATKEIKKAHENMYNNGVELANSAHSAMADSFSSVFTNAVKGDLKDLGSVFESFFDSILNSMVRIQSNRIASGLMDGLGSFLPTLFSAKGNAFVNGRVQAFATGGIVDQPTFFTYSGGTGLMGEAGTEGILPLARMRNGDLGVTAKMNNGPTEAIVTIHDESGHKLQATQSTVKTDMGKMFVDVWIDAHHNNKYGLRDYCGG